MLQPLLVRPCSRRRRRLRDRRRRAPLAGGADAPGCTRCRSSCASSSDQETLEVALIENLQRADLTPLEEAQAFRRLIDEFGHTQEQLAQAVGKSRSHIANTLRLLALPAEVQELLATGGCPPATPAPCSAAPSAASRAGS